MNKSLLALFFTVFTIVALMGQQPIINSWTINSNGNIAKYYVSNGSLTSTGLKSDITRLCYTTDSVWIKSTGMPSVFGPWLNPGGPTDQDFTFRFPRNPQVATVKTDVPTVFAVAVLINGAPIFGNGDSRSYNPSTSSNANNGQGLWNGNAYYSEGFTLDTTYAGHVNQDGTYHSHATPFKIYENYSSSVHSPIVGFAFDGFPIYGPFGYSDPMNSSSSVKRMNSGYQLRAFVNNKRTTLPDGTSATGPDVGTSFPLGTYIEDYEYVGTNADLDKYNGRYCVTPEYPNGTYAYFVTTESDGTPKFPYYIGEQYYGVVDQGNLAVNSTISMPVNPDNCIGDIPTVTLSVSSTSISENGGTSTVTATLSASSSQNITVNLGVTGTATSGTDYSLASSIVVPAGSTSKSITLTATNDTKDENNETVIIDVSSVSCGTESGTQQKTVIINDDDAAPTVTLSVGTSSITETSGSTSVTATLSAASSFDVTVSLSVSGTASATDYSLSSTSITITAGNTSGSVTLSSTSDTKDENNETVIIDISSVSNGTESGTQQKTVTINDDDAAPMVTLSAGASSINETSGSTTLTATLSTASELTVTVNLSVSGTAANGVDYSLSSTSITITAGNTTGSLTLSSLSDTRDENNETVIVDINTISNGTENGTQQTTVTIADDDNAPSVSLSSSSGSIFESAGASTITASLSAVSELDVTVTLSISGTASNTDYSITGSAITITAGNTTGTVTITAVEDATDESDETIVVDIASVSNGTESGIAQETISIMDNDNPTATISKTILQAELYPNPTTGIFKLESLKQINEIIIMNNSGSALMVLETSDCNTTIDLSNFSDGLYFIKITSDKGFDIRKINIRK